RQHRKSQTARRMKITLDLLPGGAFRIGAALIAAVTMHHPRTTAGTLRPHSSELIFAKLNRRASLKSPEAIKPFCFGLHDPSAAALLASVPLSRSRHIPPRYMNAGRIHKAGCATPRQDSCSI